MTEHSRFLQDVISERRRQIDVEGFSAEHDDRYPEGTLALAGAVYALPRQEANSKHGSGVPLWRVLWPWDIEWLKPKDRRQDLVRAAALMVAEGERFDRSNHPSPSASMPSPSALPDLLSSPTGGEVEAQAASQAPTSPPVGEDTQAGRLKEPLAEVGEGYSPSSIRQHFTDQLAKLNVTLPLLSSSEDIGVILDADGRDVITIDVNGERDDVEVLGIASWIICAINTCGGFSAEVEPHG